MTNLFAQLLVLCFLCKSGFVSSGFTTRKIGPKPIWNSTHTDKLRQDLLLNYDKFARPAEHYNVTTVSFGISIKHIEFNELKSTLTLHSWLQLLWTDEKLKWNSADYGNLSELNLADHEIWQPDIFLYNSATAITHVGNIHCIVYSNGEVLWVPPTQFQVLCSLNLKYWPFDTQHCKFIFGSWTYHGYQIDLELYNNNSKATIELSIEENEWNIVSSSLEKHMKYYSCCAEPYPDMTLDLVLKRISPSYQVLIVTPAFVVIIFILASFWLPPTAGEKIILNGCTSIIICLFLLYFTQRLPAMGTHIPLIVRFYSSCLYVVAFSILASVIVIWISRTKHISPLPWIFKRPLTGTLGCLLGLNNYIQQSTVNTNRVTAEEMRDHQVTEFDENQTGDEHHMIKTSTKMPIQNDWILLAAAIDRIAFCFFCLLFLILSVAYSV